MGSIEPELNKLAPAQQPPLFDSEEEVYTPDFSYQAFLSGEHGLGDIPGFEAYTGKPFSDLELVEAFSNLRSGENLPGTEGFLRGLIPSSAAFYTGLKGAKYGARLGSRLGPKGAVIGGGTGFVGATLLGQEGMNRVIESDFLFGKEAQYIPGTADMYEALKTAGVWAPYALIPWAIKPDVNWGASKAIDLYKADRNITTKKSSKKSAAQSVNTKNSRSKPQADESSDYLRESQVQDMSPHEYEKYADDIMEAIRSGKFIYDISGSAR